jgi:hypothetical protein
MQHPTEQQHGDHGMFAFNTTAVIIDSRDRDLHLFPNPSRYDVTLDEEIQDVTSVELMCADVPMVSYTVSARNNEITLTSSSGSTVVVQIDIGTYTKEELASAVQSALNAVPTLSASFEVVYNARLDNYDLYSDAAFSLTFGAQIGNTVKYNARTSARLLGFGPRQYASVVVSTLPQFPHVVRAPHRCDLDTDRYAVLHIEPAYVNYSTVNNTVLNKSFAILPRSSHALNLRVDESRMKTFKPPLAKFSKMRVTFYDPQGELYDFQNRDHRLEFRFTVIRQKKYSQQKIYSPFEGTISDR